MKYLILAATFFFTLNTYCQVTIMTSEEKIHKYEYSKYDSLKNMSVEKYGEKNTYHHLIGQTLLYCGDPYTDKKNINFKVGNYYTVDSIIPDDTKKGLYRRLSLVDTNTGEKYEEGGIFTNKYNFKWVVLGHYEKMKSMYLDKSFIYVGNKGYAAYYEKRNNLINLEADTVTKNIKEGTIWNCIDVQVKPRSKGDHMDIEKRSPIILIFDNPQYGKHFCYLENESGEPYENIYDKEMPLICGKFQLKSYNDDVNAKVLAEKKKKKADEIEAANKRKKEEIEARNKRKEYLIKKYGVSIADKILKEKVWVGMSKDMCRDSWGNPDDINTTTTIHGSTEQWVYGYSYVYFNTNGQVTTIQN